MGFKFNPLFGTGLTPTGGSTGGTGILADGSVPFTGDQSMGGNQLTNVGTPAVGTDAANKDYVDNNSANRTLSNLTSPTAVNEDLIFDTGAAANIQTKNEAATTQGLQLSSGTASGVGNASGPVSISSGGAAVNEDTGTLGFGSGDATGTGDSGPFFITTGEVETGTPGPMYISTGGANSAGLTGLMTISTGANAGSGGSGHALIESGDTDSGESGSVELQTGNSTSGNSGNIALNPGSAGGNRGNVSVTSEFLYLSDVNATIKTPNETEGGPSNSLTISTGNSTGDVSGNVNIYSGDAGTNENTGSLGFGSADATGTGNSGVFFLDTGSADAGDSGAIEIKTGDSASDDTGGILIKTGTAGDVRGNISLDAEQIIAFANIRPSATATWDLGSTGLKWNAVYVSNQVTSPQHVITRSSTDIGYLREDDSTLDAEIALIHITNSAAPHTYGVAVGTDTKDGATNSRSVLIRSGHTEDGTSGILMLKTGDSTGTGDSGDVTVGSGTAGDDSGNLLLTTGTAGGTRGEIRLVDGSEGTVGDVWTSTDTTGGGAWTTPAGPNQAQTFTIHEDWINSTTAGDHGWTTSTAGGSISYDNTNFSEQHWGILKFTVTNSSDRGALTLNTNTFLLGDATVRLNIGLLTSTLATVGEDYTIRLGWGDSTSADFSNGVYFEYNRSVSDNWLVKTAAGGSRTTVDTGIVVNATTWYGLEIVMDETNVDYFINGASAGNITTNIPSTSTAQASRPNIQMIKTAGTAARTADLDYYMQTANFANPRY